MNVNQRNNAVARARHLRAFAFALLAVATLWAALMAFSTYRWFGYADNGWLADIGDGTLYTTTWPTNADDFSLRGWHSAPNIAPGASAPGVWTWWQWGRTPTVSFGTVMTFSDGYSIWPLSPVLAGAGAAILITLHRDRTRRRRQNLCLNCGYPRKDLPISTRCPECGWAEVATPVAPL